MSGDHVQDSATLSKLPNNGQPSSGQPSSGFPKTQMSSSDCSNREPSKTSNLIFGRHKTKMRNNRNCAEPYSSKENRADDIKRVEKKRLKIPHCVPPKTCFSCADCKFITKWKQNLATHRARVHNLEKQFTCHYAGCEIVCGYHADLATHIALTHAKEKMYSCLYCSYSTADEKTTLKDHMIMIHPSDDTTALKCPECDYSTNSRKLLYAHSKVHIFESFSCSQCKYVTTSWKSMRSHTKKQHGEAKKPKQVFECTLCDFTSTRRKTHDAHMAICKGEHPYCCSKCDFKTTLMANLYRHAESHFKKQLS